MCSTIIFHYSTNYIIDLRQCRCRFLNTIFFQTRQKPPDLPFESSTSNRLYDTVSLPESCAIWSISGPSLVKCRVNSAKPERAIWIESWIGKIVQFSLVYFGFWIKISQSHTQNKTVFISQSKVTLSAKRKRVGWQDYWNVGTRRRKRATEMGQLCQLFVQYDLWGGWGGGMNGKNQSSLSHVETETPSNCERTKYFTLRTCFLKVQ